MHILDLIILIVIGVFIYTRFFNGSLPKDLNLKTKNRSKTKQRPKMVPRVVEFPKAPEIENLQNPVDRLRRADSSFDEASFLKGLEKAYGFYLTAWNEMDEEKLDYLLAPTLLSEHLERLDKLEEKGHRPQFELTKWSKAKILDARLNGRTLIADVQLTLEQKENYVKDDGKLVGKEKDAKPLKLVWTLARALDSDDPNWEIEMMTKPS